jgi:predicted transcriptional regulator
MKKMPCEYVVWTTLPIIRKELACFMIRDFGITQKETARILRITPAAISQYVCNKRAHNKIEDELILKEIKISSKIIIEEGDRVLNSEICRLCRMINKNNLCHI